MKKISDSAALVGDYLKSFSDEELQKETSIATKKLEKLSNDSPNSEEHYNCLAALFYFCQEQKRRNSRKNV